MKRWVNIHLVTFMKKKAKKEKSSTNDRESRLQIKEVY